MGVRVKASALQRRLPGCTCRLEAVCCDPLLGKSVKEEECTCQQTFSPQLVNSLRASSCFTALNGGAGLARPLQLPTNCLLHPPHHRLSVLPNRRVLHPAALGPHMLSCVCGGVWALDALAAALLCLAAEMKGGRPTGRINTLSLSSSFVC